MERISRRYLAGLMDGEGYLGILPADRENRQYFKPAIKIGMTSPEVIKEIHLLFGGQLYIRRYGENSKYNHYKNLLTWQAVTYNLVDKVLNYIHPYLIVKKPQADVLREFLNTKEDGCYKIGKGNGVMGNGIFLKPEIFIKRQRLYSLMRKLNQRGYAPAETKREPPVLQGDVIVRPSEKSEEIIRNDNPASELVAC